MKSLSMGVQWLRNFSDEQALIKSLKIKNVLLYKRACIKNVIAPKHFSQTNVNVCLFFKQIETCFTKLYTYYPF